MITTIGFDDFSWERYYTPDYYLPDYNLLVEIKEGGDHPNTNPAYIRETKYKVALKDEAMRKQTKYSHKRPESSDLTATHTQYSHHRS